ncbi:MAG: hypothetical protein ACR2LN_06775 [Candidatus Levyibacteriota bacterium]
MRTAIIPAQIITVEDRIAGNLTLSQIIILMIPLFFGTLVYTIFPPKMELTLYKMLSGGFIALLFMLLALRFKGKIVLQWMILLLRYNLRPPYYVFNKNDSFMREVDLIFPEGKIIPAKSPARKEAKYTMRSLNIIDTIRFERLLANPNFSLRFRHTKKGGLNVAFEQVKK